MKMLYYFLFAIITSANLFSQSLIDRGYLKLEGPLPWNDSYVIYKLTTSNERGGVAKTTFKENSHNQLLNSFEYISKDNEALVDEFLRVWKDTGSIEEDWESRRAIFDLDKYRHDEKFSKNENAVQIIEEKCELIKKRFIESYLASEEKFQRLSEQDKVLYKKAFYPDENYASRIYAYYMNYTDSRLGFFLFSIFQKELEKKTCFRIHDYTYYYQTKCENNHLINFNTLDKKVLAVCSEINANREVIFGVLKEEDLKPYKNCGFVLIRNPY